MLNKSAGFDVLVCTAAQIAMPITRCLTLNFELYDTCPSAPGFSQTISLVHLRCTLGWGVQAVEQH
jgi:hypothetical protein